MITLQILNKVIQTGDMALIKRNGLEEEHFSLYDKQFNFINSHYDKYGNVPDKETFLSKFPEFNLVEVAETDKYLLDALNEEILYSNSAEVIVKAAELLKQDSNEAVDYLRSKMLELVAIQGIGGVDIIKDAPLRLEQHSQKRNAPDGGFIKTSFPELDNVVQGWSKGEEFVVLFARTGQGKSWVLVAIAGYAWQNQYRVGYISPEMSPNKIGYRFDTVFKHFSNSALTRGYEAEGYAQYIEGLSKQETPFIVATPKDFQRKITISKLRTFCEINKLEMLCIDGVSYLVDERKERGDNKTLSLTNISEDLMALSCELGIPIVVVTQSNREGAKDDGNPALENIKDSDGIGCNATKVLSLKQNAGALDMVIVKNRDGVDGAKLTYYWDIDKGVFNYVPSSNDANTRVDREIKTKEIKDGFKDKKPVF